MQPLARQMQTSVLAINDTTAVRHISDGGFEIAVNPSGRTSRFRRTSRLTVALDSRLRGNDAAADRQTAAFKERRINRVFAVR